MLGPYLRDLTLVMTVNHQRLAKLVKAVVAVVRVVRLATGLTTLVGVVRPVGAHSLVLV